MHEKTTVFNRIRQYLLNPLNPEITMNILHTALHRFPMALLRRIFLTIRYFSLFDHFLFYQILYAWSRSVYLYSSIFYLLRLFFVVVATKETANHTSFWLSNAKDFNTERGLENSWLFQPWTFGRRVLSQSRWKIDHCQGNQAWNVIN